MRRTTVTKLTATVLAVGLLAACGGDTEPSDDESDAPGVVGELPTVTGAFGEVPEIEIPASAPGDELQVEVLSEGDGDPVETDDLVVVDYVAQVWPATAGGDEPTTTSTKKPKKTQPPADGPAYETFSRSPETFTVSSEKLLSGMAEGLTGVAAGSRIVLVLPPEDAFGDTGNEQLGVGPDDSMVFVFDVHGAFSGDEQAEGTEVEPVEGLPTVEDGDDGPEVTVPDAEPPTELVTQVLVEGDGPVVEAGQVMVAQYRGVLWKDGSEFDSSWSRDAVSPFGIGVGSVISGWDKGLVGQTAGSRVLLVVPPAEGYGEAGSPPNIAGDDTLVFVVDILGAYGRATADQPAPSEPAETPAETPSEAPTS